MLVVLVSSVHCSSDHKCLSFASSRHHSCSFITRAAAVTQEERKKWLFALYEGKDKLLKGFHANGTFDPKAMAMRSVRHTLAGMPCDSRRSHTAALIAPRGRLHCSRLSRHDSGCDAGG